MSKFLTKASFWQTSFVRRYFVSSFCFSQKANTAVSSNEKIDKKQLLRKLRTNTGYPLLKCRNALEKYEYNFEQALNFIKEEGIKEGWQKMENLQHRPTPQGLVTAIGDSKAITVIEVNCETDFVSKTEDFHNLVFETAQAIHHTYVIDKKSSVFIEFDKIISLTNPVSQTPLKNIFAQTVSKLKENIHVSKAKVICVDPNSKEYLGMYTHPSTASPKVESKLPTMGRYCAVTTLRSDEKIGKLKLRDISQHIVGMNPKTIGSPPELNEESKDTHSTEVSSKQRENDDSVKTEGSSNLEDEFRDDEDDDEDFKNQIPMSDELLKQPFLLNSELTVYQWLLMNNLELLDFERFEISE